MSLKSESPFKYSSKVIKIPHDRTIDSVIDKKQSYKGNPDTVSKLHEKYISPTKQEKENEKRRYVKEFRIDAK